MYNTYDSHMRASLDLFALDSNYKKPILGCDEDNGYSDNSAFHQYSLLHFRRLYYIYIYAIVGNIV